jgi:hypothetical protein
MILASSFSARNAASRGRNDAKLCVSPVPPSEKPFSPRRPLDADRADEEERHVVVREVRALQFDDAAHPGRELAGLEREDVALHRDRDRPPADRRALDVDVTGDDDRVTERAQRAPHADRRQVRTERRRAVPTHRVEADELQVDDALGPGVEMPWRHQGDVADQMQQRCGQHRSELAALDERSLRRGLGQRVTQRHVRARCVTHDERVGRGSLDLQGRPALVGGFRSHELRARLRDAAESLVERELGDAVARAGDSNFDAHEAFRRGLERECVADFDRIAHHFGRVGLRGHRATGAPQDRADRDGARGRGDEATHRRPQAPTPPRKPARMRAICAR